MFGFGSWKQLHTGRGYFSWGEIGHHNVGAFGSQKNIGRWGWKMTMGLKQQGIVHGCLRGASWCLLGGEQIFKGRGELGEDEGGNPLPRGQGRVDGGVVVGIRRQRPLPFLSWKRNPQSVLAFLYLI